MAQKYYQTNIHILFLLMFFSLKVSCMEQSPETNVIAQAQHYVELLTHYNLTYKAGNDFFKKIENELANIQPFDRLQLYCVMIKTTVEKQKKKLTTKLCKNIVAQFKELSDKEQQKKALSSLRSILNYQNELPCRGFIIIQDLLTTQNPDANKEKEISGNLYDSLLLDDETTLKMMFDHLNAWPEQNQQALEEWDRQFNDLLSRFTPSTQFNLLEISITKIAQVDDIAQNKDKVLLANDLYGRLFHVYECLPHIAYKKRFEALAKEYTILETIKVDTPVDLKTLTPVSLTDVCIGKLWIEHVKSPREPNAKMPSPRNSEKRSPEKNSTGKKQSIIDLQEPATFLFFANKYLMAISKDGAINCYNKGSNDWKKTLQFSGKYPLAFSKGLLPTIQSEEIQSSLIKVEPGSEISLIHSNQQPPPLCAIYRPNDNICNIIQGNQDGSLRLYVSAKDTEGNALQYASQDDHAAAITALLIKDNELYSCAQDRSIAQWEIKKPLKKKNSIEELPDTVYHLVSWQNNLIALLNNTLVKCTFEEKSTSLLPLYVERDAKITALATCHKDQLLIAGLNNGDFKIFPYGKGFGFFQRVETKLRSPVKSLFTTNDDTLITQHKNQRAMIISDTFFESICHS